MTVGLDFGTTNSVAATFAGGHVLLHRLDPAAHDPAVVRSAIYIERDHTFHIGQAAIDAYYRQNTGRPSRMVRRYVGDVQMTFGDVGTLKGYPVRASSYYQEVYVMVDELTPGRLLHSLKSGLLHGDSLVYVFDRHYRFADLVARYLEELRSRVEAETCQPVESVVLGRPVSYAGAASDDDDDRCEQTMREAAATAGFRYIEFELEPVAAALDYGRSIDRPQNVFVFDLGGGTLDITVMITGGPARSRVLASEGLGLGGDAFDQLVISGMLLEHLGQGSRYGAPPMPLPEHLTSALADWQAAPSLPRPDTLRFLHQAQLSGNHPSRVRALQSLLVNNYQMRLIDEVVRSKIALSANRFDVMRITGEDLTLWQPITRSQFESLIADAAQQIEACVLHALRASGLKEEQIDAAILTGGSSQTPLCMELLEGLFGGAKIVQREVFTSVAAGLALRGAQLDGVLETSS